MNILAGYLALGFVIIVVWDLGTGGGVRKNIGANVDETQARLGMADRRIAFVCFLVVLSLFWPAAIYGAVERRLKRR
ncbi:hypothetical protein LCGC14_1560280 [marine sediment metagenome]|uniref:Uncharacterized protein n=1 Tax=marine sediment metagenome TaxID=412755 RepID=A0A0F9J8Q9_9ZZZZ